MKVYYESSLWYGRNNKEKTQEWGKTQKINWEFEYRGQKHYIPYIYRFKKGIVFDIVTPIADEVFKEYIERYYAADCEDEQKVRELEEKHPYQSIPVGKMWINGDMGGRGSGATASLYSPIYDDNSGMYQELKKAYRGILKDEIHFGIERCCMPYPKITEGLQKLKRAKHNEVIKSLKFETREVEKSYHIGAKFKLSSAQPTYELEIEHPITKEKHILSFERGEEENWQMRGQEMYATSAEYTVTPPFKNGERLNFDSSIKYKNTPKSTAMYEPESTCSASIGIIGGASGPTVIFMTGKAEKCSCFSKIAFEMQEEAEFELETMYITVLPRQIYEYKR